jgi:hypothetical protein
MVEDITRLLEKKWLRYFLFAWVGVVLLAFSLYVCAFVRVVPPISATVVDASTEKPIPGMSACLEVTLKQVNGAILRTDVRKTDAEGRVFFWPSIHDLSLLQEWGGYSIRVTDPQTNFAVPCGENLGPRLNQGQPGLGDRGEPSWAGYFPVTMVQNDNAPETGPTVESTRRRIRWPTGMNIPLIPVMTSVEMCGQVRDSRLARSCRELNAEVAARRFRDPSPTRIARLMRVTSTATDNDWERGGPHRFVAVYSTSVTGAISPTILMTEVYTDPESAKRTYQSRTTAIPGNLPESAAEVASVAGQKIRRIRGAQDEAFWISKNRLVLVTFVESSGVDEAFLAECLTYFPSDL